MIKAKTLFVLSTVLAVVLSSVPGDPWVAQQNGFKYGSGPNCATQCKFGQFCKYNSKTKLTTCTPYCGDGVAVGVQATTGCDDGNQIQGTKDGCWPNCTIATLWSCKLQPGVLKSVCSFECGNGKLNAAYGEQCDDGNNNNGDGCTAACQTVSSFTCTNTEDALSSCTPTCGDGKIVGSEKCDDGNTDNDDGCSSTCNIQPFYVCTGVPSNCRNVCGNGLLNDRSGEVCDNGPVQTGQTEDGCKDDCTGEDAGWTCNNAPGRKSVCRPVCGDGLVKGIEAEAGHCDDGNSIANDGCSTICIVNKGYQCSGQPSTCTGICGDGLVVGAEQCDDSNTNSGDGCQNCVVTDHFACTGSPSICTNLCGNNRFNPVVNQQCDNGPSDTGVDDGCSNDCVINTGWECNGAEYSPSRCEPICGDGLVYGNEADAGNCDNDAAGASNDGCSSLCKVEYGYTCTNTVGSASSCESTCGDGKKASDEGCDDKNTTDGDGCSATCTVESGYNCDNVNPDGSSHCQVIPSP